MEHGPDWSLLAKYFKGEASEKEVRAVEAWIEADPNHRRELDEAWLAWSATEKPDPLVDTSAAWQRLKGEIDREEVTRRLPAEKNRRDDRRARSPYASRRSSRLPQRQSPFTSKRFLRAGAGFVVLLVAVSVALFWSGSEEEVLATNKGERSTIELVDGTRVHLNSDSRITIPVGFMDGQRREVHLEGEAYFEVATDASRPFLVHTQGVTTRVLGTAFNVQAYDDTDSAQVVVTEGAVELRMAQVQRQDGAIQDKMVLEPNQLGIAIEGELKAVREEVDLAAHIGWTNGELVFEDDPIEKVARKLERWYNLHVELDVPSGTVVKLNAAFDNEPMTEVLTSIATALDLQYKQDQRHVTFYRPTSEAAE